MLRSNFTGTVPNIPNMSAQIYALANNTCALRLARCAALRAVVLSSRGAGHDGCTLQAKICTALCSRGR